jgi:anthranilate/para-aminobenzoate synthase component I
MAAGDVYQVIAGRFRVASSQPPNRVYAAMRSRQPIPHGAFLDAGISRCS